MGGWARDPKMAEVGRFTRLTMENDIEGYTLFMWTQVLKWAHDEWQLFLVEMRKVLRNPRVHGYVKVRYVYGRKPEGAGGSSAAAAAAGPAGADEAAPAPAA